MDIEAAKMLGSGIAVVGVIGAGIGIGHVFAAFIQAVGRNPAAQAAVFPMRLPGGCRDERSTAGKRTRRTGRPAP